jgi:hypothetical protein
MQRTTRRSIIDDPAPRPIGQGFWLLSTMAIAAVILMTMSGALLPASGTSGGSAYSSQELLDLANSEGADAATSSTVVPSTVPTGAASTSAVPAAPAAVASATTTTSIAPAAPSDADNSTTTTSAATTSTTIDPTTSTAPVDTVPPTVPVETLPVDTPAPAGVEAVGQAALETISYPWQQLLPGWTISFLPEKSGLYGLTMVPERKIEIYVRESQSTELLAHVIAHELGHAVDVTLNDGPDRRRWEDARGLDSAPWWPGNGATDFSTGAGDFAESFAAWQVGDASFRSKLGGSPTTEQIALLAELSAN